MSRAVILMSTVTRTDRRLMSNWLQAATIGTALLLAASQPAAATAPAPSTPGTLAPGVRPADLAEPAIIAIQSEILVLVELNAFAGQLPPKISEIHAADVTFVQDLTTDGLLTWLRDADNDGRVALDAIVAAGLRPTPAMDRTLRLLDQPDIQQLQAGGQISVPAGEYAAALLNLEALASGQLGTPSGAPAGPTSTAATPDVTTIPTQTATPPDVSVDAVVTTVVADPTVSPDPVTVDPAVTSSESSGGSIVIWLAVVAGLLAAATVVAVMALRKARRRPAPALIDPRLDEVLDAGRRVTTVLEPAGMRRAAVRESIGLTGADAAALFEVQRDEIRPVVQQPNMFVHPGAVGVVERVASTGQPVRVVGLDPALAPSVPAALLVTAIATDGRVVGVIAVSRSEQHPFTQREQDRLSHLAPFIATGLEASSQHSQVTEQSMTDALTNLANRRRLDRDLGDALATRGGTVAFAMVDIDHFKTYNDTNGHPAGDDVLRLVAQLLQANVRPNDVVYRYGGEEFCVLLPDTSTDEASMVAERLRRAVHDVNFPGGDTQPEGRLTISVGVALAEQPDAADLKHRADGALYEAKRAGRDRVVVAPDPTAPAQPDAG